ncbi:hypothetical protein HD806DRAFT_550487 [Xylariaceae sp. AK1471]|nr:hypothetical protein HD806DRAFT_550487 [Xylariaceae sp. AK1471]
MESQNITTQADAAPTSINTIDDGPDPIIKVVDLVLTVAKFFYQVLISLPLLCARYSIYLLHQRYLHYCPPDIVPIALVHFIRQVSIVLLRLPSEVPEVIRNIFFTDKLVDTPLPLWAVRFLRGFIHGVGRNLGNLFGTPFLPRPASDQRRGQGGLPTSPKLLPRRLFANIGRRPPRPCFADQAQEEFRERVGRYPDESEPEYEHPPTSPPEPHPNQRQGQERPQVNPNPNPLPPPLSPLIQELHTWYSYIKPVLPFLFLYLLVWLCIYLFSQKYPNSGWATTIISFFSSPSSSPSSPSSSFFSRLFNKRYDNNARFACLWYDESAIRKAASVAPQRSRPRYRFFADGTRILMPER